MCLRKSMQQQDRRTKMLVRRSEPPPSRNRPAYRDLHRIWRATNVSSWLRVTIIGLLRSKDVGDEPSQTLDDIAQRRGKLATDRGELVGDARRNGRLRKAPDQAVPDEGSEGLREHLLADALAAVAQQMEAQRSFAD